jgi:hypothetical protein
VEGELHERSRGIRVIEDPALEPFYCNIEVGLRDGRVLRASSEPPDSLSYTWSETVSLTRALTSEWPGGAAVDAHDELCSSLVELCKTDSAVTGLTFFAQSVVRSSHFFARNETGG